MSSLRPPQAKKFLGGCAPRPCIEDVMSSYEWGEGCRKERAKLKGRLTCVQQLTQGPHVPCPEAPQCWLHRHASSRSPCPQTHAHPDSDLALVLTLRHHLRPKSSPRDAKKHNFLWGLRPSTLQWEVSRGSAGWPLRGTQTEAYSAT